MLKRKTSPGFSLTTVAFVAIATLSITSCAGELTEDELDLAEQQQALGLPFLEPDVIIEFNQLAVTIANEQDGFFSLLGHRTIAMMNIAMHDALNALLPLYEQYAYDGFYLYGHPTAALARAGRDVLLDGYPDRATEIEALYNSFVDSLPNTILKARGIHLGADSAEAIIIDREGDNFDILEPFPSSDVPGEYQYTPPFDFAFGYGWRLARPFVTTSASQFSQPPPPALTSEHYADDLNEVKALGVSGSTARTADQTHIAYWWAEFLEISHNNLAGQLAVQEDLNLWETSRLYALFAIDNFDGYVGVFAGKYDHAFWRPLTAIRRADEDGNADTSPDTEWDSEMLTPPFPTYPSAHAQACWGAYSVFVEVFGTEDVSWTYESSTAPAGGPTTRSYDDLEEAATDCGESRVYNGFHFRFDVDAGKAMGLARAAYVIDNVLQPNW